MDSKYTSARFISELEAISFEPTRMLSLMADAIAKSTDGNLQFSDPTTPAVAILELSAAMTAGAIRNDNLLNRKHYPLLATTNEDLFDHMVDRDFVDMFAIPSTANFSIFLSRSEIVENSIVIGNSKSRKLTIPKHTNVVVNGIPFTFQYPINFMIKSHGGLDVIYDLSKVSPLQTLLGNKVDWDVIKVPGFSDNEGLIELVRLNVELLQVEINTLYETVSAAKILKKTTTFKDSYHAARAYYKNSLGTWVEMKTTHSDQTFDAMDPTLLLRVIDNTLTYELPHVYMLSELVGREVRLDVYTTKGPMTMDLSGLDGSTYNLTFKDLDGDDSGLYTSPVNTLRTFDIRSTDITTGGKHTPSFKERRQRVLENNIGANVLPVTEVQMQNTLSKLGFDSSIIHDDMLSRTFLATRRLPKNTGGFTLGGIESTTMTYRTSVDKLALIPTSRHKDNRVTILPETLYTNKDGRLLIVTQDELDILDNISNEAFVNRFNDGAYLWTPFHYVVDSGDNTISAKAYSLTDPTLDVTSYIGSNETVSLTVMASVDRSIEYTKDMYVIHILSDSDKGWKELDDGDVHVQLLFTPQRESSYAYVNGVQVAKSENGERLFRFEIHTDWDITREDILGLTNFKMKSGTMSGLYSSLEQPFSLLWSTTGYSQVGVEPSSIDAHLGTHLLPANPVAIYMEELSVKLGDELSGLWARSRSLLGDKEPKRYIEDIPMVRLSNEYRVDPQTGRPVIIDTDGYRSFDIIHPKGSLVINESTGLPEILHKKGSVVMENGEPIYESDRYTMAWFDIVLFDARYRYVTYEHDVDYLKLLPRTIVDWINDALAGVRELVLENTSLFYQPKDTLRYTPALVDDGQEANVYAAQKVTVDLYVTDDVYRDYVLRGALEEAAKKTVVEMIQAKVVKTEDMERAIVDISNGDILTVEIRGIGGSANYRIVTLLDETTSMSIASTLSIMDDGTLGIVDSVQVNFRSHDLRK